MEGFKSCNNVDTNKTTLFDININNDDINNNNEYTGLPTNNETLVLTLRNVYCLFPLIHDSLVFKKLCLSLPNNLIRAKTINLTLGSSYS